MHGILFLQDLAVVMVVAGVVMVLFHRFNQPVLLGYILAGVIIGPHSPPFPLVQDEDTIKTLADLGVTFLIFILGMQFSLRTLKKVGTTAVIASGMEVIFMLFLGYFIGKLFGWSRMDSIFLGAMLSITSTTIIVKTLGDLDLLKAPFAQRIFGIQIIEDSLGMTLIVLLTGLAATGVLHFSDGFFAIGRILIFVSMVLVVGFIAVPRLIRYVAGFKNDEMLLITVLGLCFGVTFLAIRLEHSMVLGAFLIGTVLGETREIAKIKTLTEPVRDMFSAIFFVTIGMMIDTAFILPYAVPIVVIALAAVFGKMFIFTCGTFIAGNDERTSMRVGMTMIPIGELSFIIAALGLSYGVTSDFLYPIAVAVSAITMPLPPYLVRYSDRIIAGMERVLPGRFWRAVRVYHLWTLRLSERRSSLSMKLARKWVLQIGINLALIAGVFLSAAYLVYNMPVWMPRLSVSDDNLRTVYWLAAAVITLPFYVATVRKLQAIGMLLGEVSVANVGNEPRRTSMQNAIANLVLIVTCVLLVFFTMALSSAFLPPWNIMILLLVVVALITGFSWRYLIRLHSRLQGALQDTFTSAAFAAEQSEEHAQGVQVILKGARLTRLTVGAGTVAANKLLSELALRTKSGASIVAIEREGEPIVNPAPVEEILPGDTLLLLGTDEQLQRAETLLLASEA